MYFEAKGVPKTIENLPDTPFSDPGSLEPEKIP